MPRLSPSPLSLLLLLAAPAVAGSEYTVTDLGPTGTTNQPWSISPNGMYAVGYSSVSGQTQGFVADDEGSTFIGTPAGTSRTDLLGVNDLGHATGKSGTTHENGQALLWTDDGSPEGLTLSLGTLGGSRSAGTSINAHDQIVGWSHLAGDAESRPFIWDDDEMTALAMLGGTQGGAEWINDAGQIVGSTTTGTDGLQQFAVYWEDAEADPVRLPPMIAGLNNIAYYIHGNGDIAGSTRRPRDGGGFRTQAAVWRDAELLAELGTLADGSGAEPFASSWATAVNASGVVVGMSVNAESNLVPFVYRDDEMVQLSTLLPDGYQLSFVGSGALNDAGQIVVSGFMPGETGTRALLLTPVTTVDVAEGAGASAADVAPAVTLRAAPNPFRTETTLSLSIPDGRVTRIEVLDAAGRRVRDLGATSSSVVRWDGRDGEGRVVPAGVYFVYDRVHGATRRVLRVD